jgi:hypothetical protein
MKFEIKHRVTDAVLFSMECGSLKLCVKAAVRGRADLAGADLAYANLSDANLADANLAGADLAYANLVGADLAYADLSDANLAYANLAGADLTGAYLAYANLAGADLSDANLAGADLAYANLSDANLAYANLAGADLAGANLTRATGLIRPTSEEIARLDAVREIVLARPERLQMSDWHSREWDPSHTPEEEHSCGSAHCIAGWLQALSPDPEVRNKDPESAGELLAPASSWIFYRSDAYALQWLRDRAYAK